MTNLVCKDRDKDGADWHERELLFLELLSTSVAMSRKSQGPGYFPSILLRDYSSIR